MGIGINTRDHAMAANCTTDGDELGTFSKQLLFPFLCLIVGLILESAAQRLRIGHFKIPVTVFQLFVSFVVTLTLERSMLYCTKRRLFEWTWGNLEPHLIMQILLPPIIFDSAFKMDSHRWWSFFEYIAFLAVPGVLFSTAMMGGVMMLLTNVLTHLQWSLPLSFLFGGLISATDPVAVVAILEEIGAPLVLRTMIEGESLCNDGTAIVIFQALSQWQTSHECHQAGDDCNEPSSSYVKLGIFTVIGPLLSIFAGYVTAVIVTGILRRSNGDVKKEQGVLLFAVYMVYVAVEQIPTGGSGVLGVTCLGLAMSSRREVFSADTMEEITRLWEFVAYWTNAIIFILSGIVIGSSLHAFPRHMYPETMMVAVACYVFTLYSRAVVVFLMGLLVKCVHSCKNRKPWPRSYFVVMTWSGLRGAIALLLALHLHKTEEHKAEVDRDLTKQQALICAGFTVLASLFIQGTTSEKLFNKLEINKRSVYRRKRLKTIVKQLRKEFLECNLGKIQVDRKYYYLAGANWKAVKRLAADALIDERQLKESVSNTSTTNSQHFSAIEGVPSLRTESRLRLSDYKSDEEISPEMAQNEVLDIYLHLIKARIWRQLNRGLMSWKTGEFLVHAVERSIDKAEELEVDVIVKHWKVSSFWLGAAKVATLFYTQCITCKLAPKLGNRKVSRSTDWYAVFSLVLITGHSVIIILLALNACRRGLFLIAQLLCIYFVIEQLTLFVSKHYSTLRQGFGRREFRRDWIQAFLDVLFTPVYIASFFFTAIQLPLCYDVHWLKLTENDVQECFQEYKWSPPEIISCTVLVIIYELLLARFVVKFVFILPLVFRLLAEYLNEYVEANHLHVMAALNCLLKITEELDRVVLHTNFKEQEDLDQASTMNLHLKESVENALFKILKQDENEPLARLMKTRQAARIILRFLQDRVDEMTYNGNLTEEESTDLQRRLKQAVTRVLKTSIDIPPSSLEEQLHRVYWIMNPQGIRSTKELVDFLTLRMKKQQQWPADTIVFEQGQQADGMYFLTHGTCIYKKKPTDANGIKLTHIIYPGGWFGESALLSGRNPNQGRSGSISTLTHCTTFFFPKDDIAALREFDPSIQNHVALDVDLQNCIEIMRSKGMYCHWTDVQLAEYLSKHVHRAKRNKQVEIPDGYLLVLLNGKQLGKDGECLVEIQPTEYRIHMIEEEFAVTLAPAEGHDVGFYLLLENEPGSHKDAQAFASFTSKKVNVSPCRSPTSVSVITLPEINP